MFTEEFTVVHRGHCFNTCYCVIQIKNNEYVLKIRGGKALQQETLRRMFFCVSSAVCHPLTEEDFSLLINERRTHITVFLFSGLPQIF